MLPGSQPPMSHSSRRFESAKVDTFCEFARPRAIKFARTRKNIAPRPRKWLMSGEKLPARKWATTSQSPAVVQVQVMVMGSGGASPLAKFRWCRVAGVGGE